MTRSCDPLQCPHRHRHARRPAERRRSGRFAAKARRLGPRAPILALGHAGVEPSLIGIDPVATMPVALKRAGPTPGQIDVIEADGPFSSQTGAVLRGLKLDPAKANLNRSDISRGHPTGEIIAVKLLHERAQPGGRYDVSTKYICGGQGIGPVIEPL